MNAQTPRPEQHQPGCRVRIAIEAQIECEHGKAVCEICDPCECGGVAADPSGGGPVS